MTINRRRATNNKQKATMAHNHNDSKQAAGKQQTASNQQFATSNHAITTRSRHKATRNN